MPQPSRAEPTSTFILRLRAEWADDGGPRWRGRIDHLQSGEHVSFRTVDAMVGFIRRLTSWQGAEGPPAEDP